MKLTKSPLVHITLTSLPPSANNLFATIRSGRRVKTPKYQAWQNHALWELSEQRASPAPGWVAVGYTFLRPTSNRLRMDVSNRIKAVEDLLVTAGLIEDDSRVWAVSAKWTTEPGPVVDVQVWGIVACPLGGEQLAD